MEAALLAERAALAAEKQRTTQLEKERDVLKASHERLRLELELLKRRLFVAKAERVDTRQLELDLGGFVTPSPLRRSFLEELRALGGYPKKPKKYGIANGRGDGVTNGVSNGTRALFLSEACGGVDLYTVPGLLVDNQRQLARFSYASPWQPVLYGPPLLP